jgi:hypothetical protein
MLSKGELNSLRQRLNEWISDTEVGPSLSYQSNTSGHGYGGIVLIIQAIEILFHSLRRLLVATELTDSLRILRHRLGYLSSFHLSSFFFDSSPRFVCSGALSVVMGLLSCSVLASAGAGGAAAAGQRGGGGLGFGFSRSVLHTERATATAADGEEANEEDEEEGMVRYYGKETTYDTLPSLHSLGEDSTRKPSLSVLSSPVLPASVPHEESFPRVPSLT